MSYFQDDAEISARFARTIVLSGAWTEMDVRETSEKDAISDEMIPEQSRSKIIFDIIATLALKEPITGIIEICSRARGVRGIQIA